MICAIERLLCGSKSEGVGVGAGGRAPAVNRARWSLRLREGSIGTGVNLSPRGDGESISAWVCIQTRLEMWDD